MNAVKDMTLLPKDDPQPSTVALMFERLASDPNVDVEKFERLMAMQERILAYNAKSAFYAAFADMQGEMPTVMERGRSHSGRYATHEDIVEAVRPVLQKHGFMLSFRTEFPTPTTVKVVAVLAHRLGHAEQTEFLSAADTSGSKNAIQALGSAMSYGQRYAIRALLNIASREDDDDGAKASPTAKPAPAGFDDWLTDLQSAAENGTAVLSKAWKNSKPEYRNYIRAAEWERLKRVGVQATAAAEKAAQS